LIPAISIYNKDKGQYRWVKIFNLLITFVLFYITSKEFRFIFSFFWDNVSNLKEALYIQTGKIPPVINYLNFFLN